MFSYFYYNLLLQFAKFPIVVKTMETCFKFYKYENLASPNSSYTTLSYPAAKPALESRTLQEMCLFPFLRAPPGL